MAFKYNEISEDNGYSADNKKYSQGLSQKEASYRLKKYGPNILIKKKNISIFKIIIEQFNDFMVLILLAATAISVFMGEIMEAITIIAIITINAILGFVQEYRTEKTMEALKTLSAPTAKVIREGEINIIPAASVVLGDIIIVEAGDRIPADGTLIETSGLTVDESLLTGESIPVEKLPNKKLNYKNNENADENSIYMGTNITYGRGKAIVIATGMETQMGKIADMIQNIESKQTPLQKRLDHLGKFIIYACLFICAIVSITGILRGEDLFVMLFAGVSLAVAAVPEGLPAIVTVSLAIGVQRMVKKNALVKKLPAVETLGCADIICSDKTGTLTENKMTVREIFTSEGLLVLKEKGTNLLKYKTFKKVLEISVLCNNAQIVKGVKDKERLFKNLRSIYDKKEALKGVGNPTEIALLIMAKKAGVTKRTLDKHYKRKDEIPFNSERKCMSVICQGLENKYYIFTKGAPDVVIKKCSKILTANGVVNLTPTNKMNVMGANDTMAKKAFRVLAIAYKEVQKTSILTEKSESGLIFVGLIGMIDPPREEVFKAVLKCKLAGIKPIMITGDYSLTALAIAKELDIYKDGDLMLTGEDLSKMNEEEFLEVVENVSVFARVTPKHKLTIVRVLKGLGHIVAMTGDGVNDAPAVKEADIGISMGIAGTDVTKEVSSMILMDDNFATIVSAVEEGRVIYNNIRKFIRYLLSCNLGEVITMFFGMILGLPIPLLPIQILLVNLITDGLPAIALGLEPYEKDVMTKKPRGFDESIFSEGLIGLILVRGLLLGVSTLAVFASMLYYTHDINLSRTGAFATLVTTQLVHVFECKSEKKSIFEIPIFNNIYLLFASFGSFFMILLVVYVPLLQKVFKSVPLSFNDWLLIIGFSFIGPIGSSLFTKKRK
jgi:Ca2+-transporting ATPase